MEGKASASGADDGESTGREKTGKPRRNPNERVSRPETRPHLGNLAAHVVRVRGARREREAQHDGDRPHRLGVVACRRPRVAKCRTRQQRNQWKESESGSRGISPMAWLPST